MTDITKRKDDKGIMTIVEVLNEVNPILADMIMTEANMGNSHKSSVRTGIPAPTWRKLYGGVQSTKSTTQQVIDACGMLEMLPEIDVDVIDKSGDPAGTRASEQVAHIEGMSQEVANTIFYGDTDVDCEKFMGLSPRYDAYTRATPDLTKIDYNVISAGGSGSDNTSIWFITWGTQATTMIYPRGSNGGLMHEDLGKELVDASDSSGKYQAYVDKYKWDLGLTVRDWRASGRICNIDVSALESETSAADLNKLMIILSERLRMTSLGKTIIYMHPRVATRLRIQNLGADSSNTNFAVRLTEENIAGKMVQMWGEFPVHKVDAISLAEAAVTQAT
jgi:hypothetical protein